jgi:hypothetical protein
MNPIWFGSRAQGAAGGLDGLLDWIVDSPMPRLAAELPLIPGPVGAVVGGSSMGGRSVPIFRSLDPEDPGGPRRQDPAQRSML